MEPNFLSFIVIVKLNRKLNKNKWPHYFSNGTSNHRNIYVDPDYQVEMDCQHATILKQVELIYDKDKYITPQHILFFDIMENLWACSS